MYLQHLEIKSFGQLQNFSLSFPKGEVKDNIAPIMFIWPNECGKSTVLACIRSLFYGLGRNSSKAFVRRQQYLNFDGSPSTASMTFFHQASHYELQRTFGKTERTDQIKLLNLSTSEDVALDGVEPGYYLFGLTEEQFINSLLIEQMKMSLPATSSAPEIVEALTNLGLTGNSTVNVQAALAKIEEQLKELRYKRGNGGLIFDRSEKIAELKQKIEALQAKCCHFDELQRRTNEVSLDLQASQTLLALQQQQKETLLTQQQEVTDLEQQQSNMMERHYQAKSTNENEYNNQLAKSYELASKVTRLKNELNANNEALDLLDQQSKKTIQRQNANKVKLANYQKQLLALQEEIRDEGLKLAQREEDIRVCSLELKQNSEQQNNLQQTRAELQNKKEKLTFHSLQASHAIQQNKAVGYFAIFSIALFFLCIFNFINAQLPLTVVILVATLAIFVSIFYFLKRRNLPDLEKNKTELEQVGLSLTLNERELQESQQRAIDLKSRKLELTGQNKRNYIEKLLEQKEKNGRDINDLQKELKQLDQDLSEYNNQRQAKQLLLSRQKAELALLHTKNEAQQQLVENNEKFLRNTTTLQNSENEKLQTVIANKITEICSNHNWTELDIKALRKNLGDELSLVDSQIEQTHDKINAQSAELSSLKEKAKAYANSPIELAKAEEELKVLQAELGQFKARQKHLELAMSLLNDLFVSLQNDFSPKLRERCGFYLNALSLGRYTELTVDKSLHLQLRYKEDNSWHVAEYLSGAAYEQVYLALRLALCDLLTSKQKLPLLLDDCLVQFDREHQLAALQVLADFAKEHDSQLIFFSCHSYMANLLNENSLTNWQVLFKNTKG